MSLFYLCTFHMTDHFWDGIPTYGLSVEHDFEAESVAHAHAITARLRADGRFRRVWRDGRIKHLDLVLCDEGCQPVSSADREFFNV